MHECIAVIDSGGRGTVLAESYLKSPQVEKLIAIPGNDWIKYKLGAKEVKTFPDVSSTNIGTILQICSKEGVNLIDVAQDNAIAVGLVDATTDKRFTTLGPSKKAGEIEWNKAFARRFLDNLGILQPKFQIFYSKREGIKYIFEVPDQKDFLGTTQHNWFIKASGLCAGKGAIGCKSKAEAIVAIDKISRFGIAGKTYLIEEWLKGDNNKPGIEFSAFALSDGKTFKLIGSARDYKRINDFDQGENTGGMGSISPHPYLTNNHLSNIKEVFDKTFWGLKKIKCPYKGILYLGGMIVEKEGVEKLYVIEFNARWGDPEAQSIVPGIQNDFYELSKTVVNGDLENYPLKIDHSTRVVIAGVSKGYPGDYSEVINKEIFGIDNAQQISGITIYGAGMKIADGRYFANGGRLFYITSQGKSIPDARTNVYQALNEINISGSNLAYRKDIAL